MSLTQWMLVGVVWCLGCWMAGRVWERWFPSGCGYLELDQETFDRLVDVLVPKIRFMLQFDYTLNEAMRDDVLHEIVGQVVADASCVIDGSVSLSDWEAELRNPDTA